MPWIISTWLFMCNSACAVYVCDELLRVVVVEISECTIYDLYIYTYCVAYLFSYNYYITPMLPPWGVITGNWPLHSLLWMFLGRHSQAVKSVLRRVPIIGNGRCRRREESVRNVDVCLSISFFVNVSCVLLLVIKYISNYELYAMHELRACLGIFMILKDKHHI